MNLRDFMNPAEGSSEHLPSYTQANHGGFSAPPSSLSSSARGTGSSVVHGNLNINSVSYGPASATQAPTTTRTPSRPSRTLYSARSPRSPLSSPPGWRVNANKRQRRQSDDRAHTPDAAPPPQDPPQPPSLSPEFVAALARKYELSEDRTKVLNSYHRACSSFTVPDQMTRLLPMAITLNTQQQIEVLTSTVNSIAEQMAVVGQQTKKGWTVDDTTRNAINQIAKDVAVQPTRQTYIDMWKDVKEVIEQRAETLAIDAYIVTYKSKIETVCKRASNQARNHLKKHIAQSINTGPTRMTLAAFVTSTMEKFSESGVVLPIPDNMIAICALWRCHCGPYLAMVTSNKGPAPTTLSTDDIEDYNDDVSTSAAPARASNTSATIAESKKVVEAYWKNFQEWLQTKRKAARTPN
ncbi:hypothetical protein BV22DRAFT_1135205 [Leucogyrophana mollusca]|uniref:Uncharacterized protein n=1 Tax=Leucogyrophana mollusca TaxID=85980 RepID=A0ACB8AZ23_9AGAM|nr:hypothetical protein BV22DRAFT_1135205 [Leucogyrophana mollusca]